ncbi:MAG: hypothetical protein IKJ59_00330 [Clostridia bacterium]|nr:hypothetical protein [Clostridia bacterium]
MPSIKDNIKEELLKKIYDEETNVMQRIALTNTAQEAYECTCERNFLNKLKEWAETL